ncbi:hypothetical protein E2I00_005909, partial [Balaenoptera physalus]
MEVTVLNGIDLQDYLLALFRKCSCRLPFVTFVRYFLIFWFLCQAVVTNIVSTLSQSIPPPSLDPK